MHKFRVGTLQGRGDKAVFTPSVVQRTQDQWICNFYNDNNYIEYDAAKRFGINDVKNYLKVLFPPPPPKNINSPKVV